MSNSATTALNIHTYHAAKNQVTHPNVIAFETPWHGYRYYMAYTPFPDMNGSEENPCIAVSNDLLHWEKPDGLINPIAWCEETECDELKDTHLLYREDLDRLELWYLGRVCGTIKDKTPLCCFRKVSADGIHWGTYEVMYRFAEMTLASPSVIHRNGAYHFWGIRHSEMDIGLYYMQSEDGFQWSELDKCQVPKAQETDMWHGAVTLHQDTFYFVWVGASGGASNCIYIASGSDEKSFSDTRIIIRNDARWAYFYRPALLIHDGMYYCFYGVIRCDGKWLIAMSRGKKLSALQGISTEDVGYHPELVPGSTGLRIKTVIKGLRALIVPRLFVLAFPLTLTAFHSVWFSWILGVLTCGIAHYIWFYKKSILQAEL